MKKPPYASSLRRRILQSLGLTTLAVSGACSGPQAGELTDGQIANRPSDYKKIDPVVALANAQTCEEVPELVPGAYKGRVCHPFSEDGTPCAPSSGVNAEALVAPVLGPPVDDGMCYRMTYVECGPVEQQDACCYDVVVDMECMIEGRPFFIDGEMQLAPLISQDGWCNPTQSLPTGLDALDTSTRQRLAAAWAEVGLHEHASVSAFARFVMQLMALGAPSELIEDAVRAMHDEIEHARLAFDLASAFAGHPLSAGPLPANNVVIDSTPEHVLWDTLVEGCVCETIAAMQARIGCDLATDESARAALEQIAEDESRHAILAWKTVRWMLERSPGLRKHARSALKQACVGVMNASAPAEQHDDGALPAFGRLGAHAMQAIARDVVEHVVRPCGDALFGLSSPIVVL